MKRNHRFAQGLYLLWAGAGAPLAPTGLIASPVSVSQINLSWTDNATNETGYKIYRSTDGVSYSVLDTIAAGSTSYNDTSIAPGTVYSYKVAAYNASGEALSDAFITSTLRYLLASRWTFDESSAGSAPVTRSDTVGSNHLSDNNTVASTPALLNNGAVLVIADSTNLSIADNASLSMGAGVSFAYAGFFKTGSSVGGTQMILAKWQAGAGQREYQLYIYGSKFNFDVRNVADNASGTVVANNIGTLLPNTQYFISIGHDAVNDILYISVNAGTRNTLSYSGDVQNGATIFRFGASGTTAANFAGGILDEWCFWKGRVLETGEEASMYNGGNGLAINF